MDGKHLMRIQSEDSGFQFLLKGVRGTEENGQGKEFFRSGKSQRRSTLEAPAYREENSL